MNINIVNNGKKAENMTCNCIVIYSYLITNMIKLLNIELIN